jgi:hypothetical protein
MPSELDFDIIKGLSKWRSELETYIDFENVFGNISKITYDSSIFVLNTVFSIFN